MLYKYNNYTCIYTYIIIIHRVSGNYRCISHEQIRADQTEWKSPSLCFSIINGKLINKEFRELMRLRDSMRKDILYICMYICNIIYKEK